MKMSVLSSGSHGNCYILESSTGHKLIIECGIPIKDIKKGLKWQIRGIEGCIFTHCHLDHALSAKDLITCGVHCYALKETAEHLGIQENNFFHPILPQKGYQIGEYKILTIPVVHDVSCLAFIITHPEMGHTLFITDTMMLEYKIPKLSHIMIECNYSDKALQEAIDTGRTAPAMRQRLLQTHMELETTVGVLKANDLSMVNEIVLLHLSGQNSDGSEFVRRVQSETGKPTYVARKGLELEFNK